MKSFLESLTGFIIPRGFAHTAMYLTCAASALATPRIDSVGRTAQCDGQGADYSPYAEDDQALSNSMGTLLTGTFSGHVALPIALNGNLGLYTADHASTVNPADLTFSSQGSERIDQDATFDASDCANGAFHQGSSLSGLTIFFTLANSGKVTLSTTLSSARAYSSTLSPALVGGASAQIQIVRGTTVIWSRYIQDGSLSFSGDVVLPAAGQYQLSIIAAANLSLNASTTGPLFTEATSSYVISGKITENPASGGGKKK